jgi:peptidyl-tRNA hydrolase, PTH1 family
LKVVLGLGNPGPRYAGTRHNAGHAVVELLARRWGIALDEGRDAATGGAGDVAGRHVYLAVSRVFMNESGQAARALWNRMGRQAGNLVLVHDDIDLPLGTVRLKEAGGDGGHRGVQSVALTLADPGFVRVRVGVGRPDEKAAVVGHVLSRFSKDEAKAADAAIERGADAVEALLAEGLVAAQGKVHAGPPEGRKGA